MGFRFWVVGTLKPKTNNLKPSISDGSGNSVGYEYL